MILNNMNKFIAILIVILLSINIFIYFNQEKKEEVIKSGEVVTVLFEKEAYILSQSNIYNILARYPIVNKGINENFNKLLLGQIESFKEVAEENAEFIPDIENRRFIFDADYYVESFSEDIKSYAFTISTYSGGAHGYVDTITQTYDIKTGEMYDLQDVVLDMELFSQVVKEKLLQKFESFYDEDLINDGIDPNNKENYERFLIARDSLIIYFPPYQVASYAEGTIVIEIYFEEIKNIIDSNFIK